MDRSQGSLTETPEYNAQSGHRESEECTLPPGEGGGRGRRGDDHGRGACRTTPPGRPGGGRGDRGVGEGKERRGGGEREGRKREGEERTGEERVERREEGGGGEKQHIS